MLRLWWQGLRDVGLVHSWLTSCSGARGVSQRGDTQRRRIGLPSTSPLQPPPSLRALIPPSLCSFFEPAPAAPHSLVVPGSAPATLVDYPAAWHPKQGLLVGLTCDGTSGTATLQEGAAAASAGMDCCACLRGCDSLGYSCCMCNGNHSRQPPCAAAHALQP